jgi:hypothetical protein
MAVVAGLGLVDQVFANCQGEGPYEVIQCGQQTWFAPPPTGTGTIKSQWWQLGFGNATNAPDPTASKGIDGSGFYYYAGYSTVFLGIDSGQTGVGTFQPLDLAPAALVGGPVGALCFSSAANWGAPGVDGCPDNNRASLTVPAPGADGSPTPKNLLNPYFAGTVIGTLRYNQQVDSPMAVLLTESSGRNFALAFFATASRGASPTRENDASSGNYQMGALINGDPNPVRVGQNNIVPWQPVPDPNIAATFVNPGDTVNSDRILAVSWSPIRLVHDGSVRKCRNATNTADCTTLGTLAGNTVGVGVLDQGPLAHYMVEKTPLNPTTLLCDSTWVSAGPAVDHPASSTSVTVGPNTCVRLTTAFGRSPQVTFVSSIASDATSTAMWDASVRGRLGDIGYGVSSAARQIGGPQVSQQAVLTVATKNKNAVTVKWQTTTELNITGFDIVGIDQRGGRKVLASAACKSCTTGLGESYTQVVPAGQLQGSKKIQVVMKPSGEASNILDVK